MMPVMVHAARRNIPNRPEHGSFMPLIVVILARHGVGRAKSSSNVSAKKYWQLGAVD
jgi:hypothetical protein